MKCTRMPQRWHAKRRNDVEPVKGNQVMVVGLHSAGSTVHPGIITKVWPVAVKAYPGEPQRVNVTVFLDENLPTSVTSLPLYTSLAKANTAQARLPFCYLQTS